jgi:hypothetical protein
LKAYCLIRTQPHYRHEAFVAGLKRCGYDVRGELRALAGAAGDVLVIWNRYGDTERIADKFEAAGGTVLVAENGYIGQGGGTPKLTQGAGQSLLRARAARAQRPRRVARRRAGALGALGIELKPWRTDGDHILVCANRSFGMQGGIMPHDWASTWPGACVR